MAIATVSMTVASGVQPFNAAASSTHAELASGSRLAGVRLNNVALAGVSLRSPGRPATGRVRAEEGLTDKVQEVADGASRQVQKAAGGIKGFIEGFGSFFSNKKSQAADATRDLEDRAKSDSGEVRREAEKLDAKAKGAVGDAADSLKRSFDSASRSAEEAGKDLRKEAESAGDAAGDTARDLKRDVEKGVDRMKS